MKQTRILIAVSMLFLSVGCANAMTLEAGIEQVVILEQAAVVEKSDMAGRIGVRINSIGEVNYVHPDSPADHAGLIKGDHVTLVDGCKHNVRNICGPAGTFVELEIKRRQVKEPFTLAIERIDINTIRE